MKRKNRYEQTYWTAEPAYQYLNKHFPIGIQQVRRLMKSGEIQTVSIMKQRYTTRELCDQWMASAVTYNKIEELALEKEAELLLQKFNWK